MRTKKLNSGIIIPINKEEERKKQKELDSRGLLELQDEKQRVAAVKLLAELHRLVCPGGGYVIPGNTKEQDCRRKLLVDFAEHLVGKIEFEVYC